MGLCLWICEPKNRGNSLIFNTWSEYSVVKLYEQFALNVEISEKKKVVLVQDNTGWHKSKEVVVPEGIIE